MRSWSSAFNPWSHLCSYSHNLISTLVLINLAWSYLFRINNIVYTNTRSRDVYIIYIFCDIIYVCITTRVFSPFRNSADTFGKHTLLHRVRSTHRHIHLTTHNIIFRFMWNLLPCWCTRRRTNRSNVVIRIMRRWEQGWLQLI